MPVSCTTLFCNFILGIIGFIDFLIPVLAGVAVVLFLASMVMYIYKAGDVKNKQREKQAMLWGLVALFVLFSIWGILRVLDQSFFGGGGAPLNNNPIDVRPESLR